MYDNNIVKNHVEGKMYEYINSEKYERIGITNYTDHVYTKKSHGVLIRISRVIPGEVARRG